ncbi:MAG: phosphohydrolase, partial [Gemmatimonadetes bacterium]|nr:phosphohydrolase [Gemmatimonadota bacterium]
AEPSDIEREFGPRVRGLVDALTDDKSLRSRERKRLQVVQAPHLEPDAKMIKIADKTANVYDVGDDPPSRWPLERRRDYLEWTERVVAGCRGVNEALDSRYDAVLVEARARLEADPAPGGAE